MQELVDAIIKSYGLIGLFMVAPVAATVVLWKYIERTQKNHKAELAAVNSARIKDAERFSQTWGEMTDRVVRAHEQRVVDAQSISMKLMEMASEQAAMTRETNIALDRIGDLLSTHPVSPALPPHGND